MLYEKSTLYVTGTAKIGKTDPIASMYELFFVGLIIDKNTHRIVDFTCNMVSNITSDFIKSLVLDADIMHGEEALIDEIKERFHGLAQKTVCASIKDARNKYLNILNG